LRWVGACLIKNITIKEQEMELKHINREISQLATMEATNYISQNGLEKLREFRYLNSLHQEKLKTLDIAVLLSDENIKKMANEYTGGEEGYGAFILACNVIAKKIRKLC